MGESVSIFIFEDDIFQAQHIKELVEEICEEKQITYDFIEVTSRAENIIEKIHHTTHLPIYFLDIEIKSVARKGLEVAQMIRKHDPNGIIVFVTTHSEFAPISYEYMVSAFTFIDKSLPYEERYKLFEQCLLHYAERNNIALPADDLLIKNKHTTIRVPFATVQYVKTDEPHRLILVTTERHINFYGTIKEIATLDQRLLRCHQSYVVNIEAVATYDTSNRLITMKNNEQIPVSRRLSRTVRQAIGRV